MHMPGNYDYVGLVPDPEVYAVYSLATDLKGILIDIHHGHTSQSILRKSLSILTRHFTYYFVVRTRAALSGEGRTRTYY
jgi:hypothetical protein